MVLIGFVGAILIVGRDALDLRLLHISAYTPIIILLYLVAMRAAFVSSAGPQPVLALDEGRPRLTLGGALMRYAIAAAIIVAAGSWLPFVGLELAKVMGWHTTFVGTLFIAGATSLPELVVTTSAFRLGAVDMAVANLLGSNLFDMIVLAIDDLAFTKGSLLASVSPVHAVSAFAAVIMTGIFIVGSLYKPTPRFRGTIGWVSLSLLVIYVLSAYAVYLHGH